MPFHTIRGRLILWLTLLMIVVVSGFGVTVFQMNRAIAFDQIDNALDQRVALLEKDWRASFPSPPTDRETPFRRFRGNGGPRRGRDSVKRAPASPSQTGLRMAEPERHVTLSPFGERAWPAGTLTLSKETEALFSDKSPQSYYYSVWRPEGGLAARSENVPDGTYLPLPESREESTIFQRSIGRWRESYLFTERGDCILAGIDLTAAFEASHRFAWTIVIAGAAVLLVGAGGGWLIISHSFRPIHEIGETAGRIAAGNLAERVTVGDAKSELGALAAVLNSTFARLDGAFAEQKTFTADASHELRTPLTVILTETQRSLARERTVEEYRRTVQTCHVSASEMKRVTESLLELAWLDADQGTAQTRVNLGELANEAARTIQPLCAERRIELVIDVSAVVVAGDPERLRRVASNLLQNALRYNRDGGRIVVSTAPEGDCAVLRVSDTGIGIPPEDLKHIFKRFYRVDKSRSRAEGNTGLGLSICDLIVKRHGGSIQVESTLGKGSTFTVKIPRAA